MSQGTSTHSCETMEGGWHVDTSDCHNVTWSTLSGVYTLCDDAHSTRNMSNGYLIRWLLNLDLLVANKFA